MKKINRYIFFVFGLSILCLSGCKNEDEVLSQPVGFGDGKEVIETTTANAGVEINSEFAVKDSNTNVHQFEPVYIEEENLYNDDNASADDVAVYYNTITDPITGQDVSISTTSSLSQLQEEAKNIYKPLYESGDLSKDDIQTVVNVAYGDLAESDRQKVLNEIFSSDEEVEVSETEATVSSEEETISDEEFQQILADIRAGGASVLSDIHLGDDEATGGGTSGDDGLPAIISN